VVGVVLVVPRRRLHPAAPQQQLHRRGRNDAGAKLDRRDRGRAFPPCEVDPGAVHEVRAVQPGRRQPHQETEELLGLGLSFEAEVALEAHAARREDQQAGAHADWGGRNGGDAALGAAGENLAADGDFEKIEPVGEQMRAVQEVVDLRRRDRSVEAADAEFGVDGARHHLHHRRFGSVERVHRGAGLPVEICNIKTVEVRDRECPDAQSRKREQMGPSSAAQTRDRDPLGAQSRLFPLGEPAEIAVERNLITESRWI